MHLVGYYQVPGTRYHQVPGTKYQVLPGTARYYLVGVNVEFLPLAVRLLFVGGTNTIPPDVMIVSIIMVAVKMNNDGLSSGTSLFF